MKSKINDKIITILDLGIQPVSNRFKKLESVEKAYGFPMKIKLNTINGRVFLDSPFPVNQIKPRYDWLTCFEPEDHLDELVSLITQLPDITKQSIFAGYSFKDDTTLIRLNKKNYINTWRIDPQDDLGISDSLASIETYQSVLSDKIVKIFVIKKAMLMS